MNDMPREVARWKYGVDTYRIVHEGVSYSVQCSDYSKGSFMPCKNIEHVERVLCRYIEAGK